MADKSSFWARLIAASVMQLGVFALLLFLPAGTWRWWQAWVFLAGMAGLSVWTVRILPRDILEARLKPPLQQGQPLADKVIVVLLLTAFYAEIVFIPLDVFRFHLLPLSGPYLSAVGMGLLVVGMWLGYLALRENTFAGPAVRHQEERGQQVVDTGVYAVVHHPMYAGAVLFFIGLPLWLGSIAGALVALIPSALLVIRIPIEERFLMRVLPGYADYAQRVRYRLIPRLW